MQNCKNIIKQGQKLLRLNNKNLYAFSRTANRECFAKQNFAQKMQRMYSNTGFKSLNQKSIYKFSYPEYTKLKMPALSPSMEKGVIQEWNFKEGDFIEEGSTICEVETDKSTVGFTVLEDMYMAKILIPAGGETDVGSPVAIAVEEEEDVAAFENFTIQDLSEDIQQEKEEFTQQIEEARHEPEQVIETPPQQVQQQQSVQTPTYQTQTGGRIFISPLARKIALDRGIDISQIQGSGPGGRIIESDVLSFQPSYQQQQSFTPPPQQQQQVQQEQPVAAKEAAPAAAGAPQKEAKKQIQFSSSGQEANPYTDIPNNSMRKTIAKRLVEAKTQVPHFYLSIDVCVDKLLATRKELNSQPDTKISVNDFVVRASALALRDFPEANARWFDDKIRLYKNADISVAVSTDGGLITPIVFGANQKGLKEISAEVKELAGKARNNTLKPEEYSGGTFSISNLGMFGIDHFIAISNPPQACILAVSQSNKKMVYDKEMDVEGCERPFKVKSIMNVTLSCDHRAVDGAVGAQFLQKFKYYIENPTFMLL